MILKTRNQGFRWVYLRKEILAGKTDTHIEAVIIRSYGAHETLGNGIIDNFILQISGYF